MHLIAMNVFRYLVQGYFVGDQTVDKRTNDRFRGLIRRQL